MIGNACWTLDLPHKYFIYRENGGEVFILGCLAGGSPVNIYKVRSGDGVYKSLYVSRSIRRS